MLRKACSMGRITIFVLFVTCAWVMMSVNTTCTDYPKINVTIDKTSDDFDTFNFIQEDDDDYDNGVSKVDDVDDADDADDVDDADELGFIQPEETVMQNGTIIQTIIVPLNANQTAIVSFDSNQTTIVPFNENQTTIVPLNTTQTTIPPFILNQTILEALGDRITNTIEGILN